MVFLFALCSRLAALLFYDLVDTLDGKVLGCIEIGVALEPAAQALKMRLVLSILRVYIPALGAAA